MIKKSSGITLTSLVITIIVISILVGVSINASSLLIEDTKNKAIISNMYLIKGKVETIYDDYVFNENEDILKSAGTDKSNICIKKEVSSLSEYGVAPDGKSPEETIDNFWYIWDRNTIINLGFDENMLSDGANYIINYATGEIIYTLGIKDNNGQIKYKLSEIRE